MTGPPVALPAGLAADGNGEPCRILGIAVSPLDLDAAVARIAAMLRGDRTQHVVLANAHTMNCAAADPACRAALQRAALVLRDGVGLELAGALYGRPLRYNFVGTDFVPQLLERLAGRHPVRIFLFGGEPGVAAGAAAVLRARCAGIEVVGTEHGFDRGPDVVARIRAARPDILLVGLGNPLQERWIDAHAAALGVPVAIGVGALFDYLTGRLPRAPRWLRRARGEWVFRLLVEPRRLWRRYLVGNAQFLWRVLRERRAEGGA